MTLGLKCCNWTGSGIYSHNTIHRRSHLLRVICGGYGSIRSILSSSLFIPTKIHVSRSSEILPLSQDVLTHHSYRVDLTHLWTWTLGCLLSVSRPVPPRMSMPLGLDSLQAGVPFPASLPVWCLPLPLGEVTSGFWT